MDPIAFSTAKRRLLEQIQSACSEPSSPGVPQMIRCKVEVENVAAMQWLACQSIPIKTYWANRNQEFKMAGLGVAHEISGQEAPDLTELFKNLRTYLDPKYPELRYYGGFQFNQGSKPSQEWKSFGAYRFIIPQFELHRSDEGTFLVCNFIQNIENCDPPEGIVKQLEDVQFELTLSDWEERTILHRRDIPDRAEWQSSLDSALEEMEAGKYEKVVLARKATLTFNDPVDPVAYLLRLRRMTEETFNFYFQADEGHAFLGATPERLFKRQSRTLHTEAIAGTRPRGLTTRDDERYAKALLNSEKEVREHSIVVDMIQNVLEKFCHNLVVDEDVQITKLSHVQHLCKHFKGQLDPDTSDADLIEALHPTPAMGGYPTDKALEAIEDLEPFNRG